MKRRSEEGWFLASSVVFIACAEAPREPRPDAAVAADAACALHAPTTNDAASSDAMSGGDTGSVPVDSGPTGDAEPGDAARSDAGMDGGSADRPISDAAVGPPRASLSDAGSDSGNEGTSLDSGSDACAPRELRLDAGTCTCPPEDVLCPTRGYAHFVVSNEAGSGLPNEAAYLVGDTTVEDTISGLVWERRAPTDPMSFADAASYCAGLVLDGRDDFRLPGRIELVTLLDFDELPVAPDVFDEVVADYHWTSSPSPSNAGSVYTVYFGSGEVTIADASPGRGFTRCVAGKVAEEPTVRFQVSDERVTDVVTGLEWERFTTSKTTWNDATTRCSNVGMRLPSLRELQSIIDETHHAPALDVTVFGGKGLDLTWTGSTRGESPWTIDFSDGKSYANVSPTDELASRCVR